MAAVAAFEFHHRLAGCYQEEHELYNEFRIVVSFADQWEAPFPDGD